MRIFFSYAHDDYASTDAPGGRSRSRWPDFKRLLDELEHLLRDVLPADCFVDRNQSLGYDSDLQVFENLRTANVLLVFLTQTYLQKSSCRKELRYFAQRCGYGVDGKPDQRPVTPCIVPVFWHSLPALREVEACPESLEDLLVRLRGACAPFPKLRAFAAQGVAPTWRLGSKRRRDVLLQYVDVLAALRKEGKAPGEAPSRERAFHDLADFEGVAALRTDADPGPDACNFIYALACAGDGEPYAERRALPHRWRPKWTRDGRTSRSIDEVVRGAVEERSLRYVGVQLGREPSALANIARGRALASVLLDDECLSLDRIRTALDSLQPTDWGRLGWIHVSEAGEERLQSSASSIDDQLLPRLGAAPGSVNRPRALAGSEEQLREAVLRLIRELQERRAAARAEFLRHATPGPTGPDFVGFEEGPLAESQPGEAPGLPPSQGALP